ncbi:hypothetical protein M6D81_26510 [Paenibacillus sp. J5C_2022]|uniref:hypothetical protein n=1 Tax=Paenibacillus sp. J5C2022 TaxID=2977129 RepID=UPI0021D1AE01|nr:hypothetical protein [Paenibacillus sp. J5C2022]MCU6712259.1 hypothetical protein [Paenibacillus sp. J5C2022]
MRRNSAAAAVLAAFIWLAGCGASGSALDEADKVKDGVEVSEDGSEVTIYSSDDGEITVRSDNDGESIQIDGENKQTGENITMSNEQELPEGLPELIDLPDDAVIITSTKTTGEDGLNSYLVAFQTMKSIAECGEQYEGIFETLGFEVARLDTDGTAVLTGDNTSGAFTVMIMENEQEGAREVTISYTEKQ